MDAGVVTSELANQPQTNPQVGHGQTVEVVIPVRGMNCQSCIHHVGDALRAVQGVTGATVDLKAGQARVRFDSSLATTQMLREAIEEAGYVAEEPVPAIIHAAFHGDPVTAFPTPSYVSSGSAVAGLLASGFLVGFYFVVMTVAQGSEAAIELLEEDWYLVAPLVVGFGIQVALFWRIRQLEMGGEVRSARTVTGASGGLSGLSMLACCAHHLADLLPVLGVAGLAVFLAEYRQPLMGLGIASNLVGIAFMGRVLMRWRQLV